MEFNAENVIVEIDKVSDYLTDKLQVPVEVAYGILMRQVYFNLILNIIWIVVSVIVIVLAIILVKKKLWIIWESKGGINDKDFAISFMGIVYLSLTVIISTTVLPTSIYNVLQIIINPEWYMFQMIIDKIG